MKAPRYAYAYATLVPEMNTGDSEQNKFTIIRPATNKCKQPTSVPRPRYAQGIWQFLPQHLTDIK